MKTVRLCWCNTSFGQWNVYCNLPAWEIRTYCIRPTEEAMYKRKTEKKTKIDWYYYDGTCNIYDLFVLLKACAHQQQQSLSCTWDWDIQFHSWFVTSPCGTHTRTHFFLAHRFVLLFFFLFTSSTSQITSIALNRIAFMPKIYYSLRQRNDTFVSLTSLHFTYIYIYILFYWVSVFLSVSFFASLCSFPLHVWCVCLCQIWRMQPLLWILFSDPHHQCKYSIMILFIFSSLTFRTHTTTT